MSQYDGHKEDCSYIADFHFEKVGVQQYECKSCKVVLTLQANHKQ